MLNKSMPYQNIREEELKNQVARDYFRDFDCTRIIGNVDFCVVPKFSSQQILLETQSLQLFFKIISIL